MALHKPSLWLAFIQRSLIDFLLKTLSQTLLCIILIANAVAQQQQTPVKLPPTPNAASFLKYGETPVNTYTGTPDISIPVYTISKGDFSLPITLRYHASGIKVGEEASWVGLGWNLDAGGVISFNRTVGVETPSPCLGSGVEEINGAFSDNSQFYPEYQEATVSYYGINSRFDNNDFAPIIYSFSFCGYTGKFVENPFVAGDFSFMSNSGVKLWVKRLPSTGTDDALSGFVVTNEKGIKYYFEKYEETIPPSNFSNLYTVSFHLTKINFPDLTEADDITFEYSQPGVVYDYKRNIYDISFRYTWSSPKVAPFDIDDVVIFRDGDLDTYNQPYFVKGVENSPLFLSNIKTRGLTISFKTSNRTDMEGPGAKKLDAIEVYNISATVPEKTFSFSYDYFGSGDQYLGKRLKLIEFLEGAIGNTTIQPHKFTYNETVSLPYKNSLAQDFWGYYNGINNSSPIPDVRDWSRDAYLISRLWDNTYLPSNRGSSPTNMQANILTAIQYPTGGYTAFKYEPHDFSNHSYRTAEDIKANGHADIYQIKGAPLIIRDPVGSASPEFLNFTVKKGDRFEVLITFEYSNLYDNASPNIGCFDYTLKRSGYTSEPLDVNGNPVCKPACIYGGFKGLYEFISPTSANGETYELMIALQEGACNNFPGYPGGVTAMKAVVTIYELKPIPLGGPGIGGGLRIKAIDDYNVIKASGITSYKVRSKIYDYINEDGKTSGKLMVPLNFLNKYAFTKKTYCPPDEFCSEAFNVLVKYNFLYSNGINFDGSPVGYSRVEIVETGNGKIIEKYTNKDPGIKADLFDYKCNSINVNNPPGNGNLISKEIFNEQKQSISLDMFEYYSPELVHYPSYTGYLSVNINYEFPTYAYGYNYKAFEMPIISYQNVLTCKTHIENSNDGNNLTTETSNVYDETTWQLTKKLFTTSKGETIITSYTYPNNISAAPYNAMKDYNMLGVVVNEQTKVNGTQIEATNKVYKNSTSPPFLLDKIQKWKSSSLFTDELVFDKYDNTNANVLQYTMKDGITTSLIYGYDKVYPIAEVKNAKSTDAAYTSFETQANVEGNWETSSNIRDVTVKVSGVQSYNMTNANVKCTGLDVAKQYVVSFWARSDKAKVNGADPIAGETKNGWTYYELTVSNVSNVVVSATSATSVVIDELRLCPVDATMRSFCYFPGVGVSSVTDENSVTTFYQYDDLNRLKAIVDSEGNMLKSFEYNYQK